MRVRIKKLNEFATIPQYATDGSAGMDITAISRTYDDDGNVVYGTGLAFEIPEGCVGLLFPRSSNAKKDLLLSNSVGVIDSDYRGEVCVILVNLSAEEFVVEDGERIAQMVIARHEQVEWQPVEVLEDTERGAGGFGHSGTN